MPKRAVELNRGKVAARLRRDGWINKGGGRHDVYVHAAHHGVLIVIPLHRTLSPGVARAIAKQAGWL